MKSHGVDTKTAAFGLLVVEILFFNRGFGLAHRISKATHGSNFNRNSIVQWSNGPLNPTCQSTNAGKMLTGSIATPDTWPRWESRSFSKR